MQLSTCKYNTTAKTCSNIQVHPSTPSTPTPAACPKKQTIESALPDADLFHQPVPSPLLGKQPLSVIGFLTAKDLTPQSPRSEPQPAGVGPHPSFPILSHFQTYMFLAHERDMLMGHVLIQLSVRQVDFSVLALQLAVLEQTRHSTGLARAWLFLQLQQHAQICSPRA